VSYTWSVVFPRLGEGSARQRKPYARASPNETTRAAA
jgi:hypothetical protein